MSEHSSPSMKDVKKMVEPCRESDIKAEETMESKEEDINSYFKSCVEQDDSSDRNPLEVSQPEDTTTARSQSSNNPRYEDRNNFSMKLIQCQ